MLPNFNMKEFIAAGKKTAEELEKEDRKKKSECSQQSIANRMVGQSMPNNPNAQPVQQAPAQQ